MERISENESFNKIEKLDEELEGLKKYLQEANREEKSAHEVEKGIWKKVLEIGYQALGWFLEAQGEGDMGKKLEVEEKMLKRSEKLQKKEYKTVFGEYSVKRYTYAQGEKQKIECIPLDSKLSLPESKYSYLLQDFSQLLCVETPYRQVSRTLEKIFSQKFSVDTLEKINRDKGKHVKEYRESKPAPNLEDEGDLIVVGGDGKGVPIRHERDRAKIEDHKRKRGPKPNRKKMAIVGVSYSIDPHVRTADQVVTSLFAKPSTARTKGEKKRPRPQNKQVFVSLTQNNSGVELKATDTVFDWMAQQLELRNPQGKKVVLVLMDGQPSLWEAAEEKFTHCLRIEILDLLHVTPRLWDAANIFFGRDSNELIPFIKLSLLRILHGDVSFVIQRFRSLAIEKNLTPKKLDDIRKICSYFTKNQHRMKYHLYLQKGYPIATGVLEGACRHFVKDRFERTGMRWSLCGAQAMLDLRATYLNGDWDSFISFRIQFEQKILYPYSHLFQKQKCPIYA